MMNKINWAKASQAEVDAALWGKPRVTGMSEAINRAVRHGWKVCHKSNDCYLLWHHRTSWGVRIVETGNEVIVERV
jgi:hypothetical protein